MTASGPPTVAAVDKGLVRHIGLSNYSVQKMSALLETARIRPAVDQVELHPYLQQDALVAFCAEQGIAYGSIEFTDEQIASDIRNSDADAHANERGHEHLAAHVLRELERLGLP